jgi:predicted dehydrogenase
MKTTDTPQDFTRRDFLKGGSLATFMTFLGGVELAAQTDKKEEAAQPQAQKTKCAVIGCGIWGREIVTTLSRVPTAEVAALCDKYPAYLKRAGKLAPEAKTFDDYTKILQDKEIPAVIIATPSHLHKQLAIDALQAGKHVYCEAPLATSVEDARAIALAAKKNPKVHFQAGLQLRSDPQRTFVLNFIRSGAWGKAVMARAQWHKKQSWRFTSPDAEREKEINWRLDKGTSGGLVSEVGIHQLDAASWYLGVRPITVGGFGSLMLWKDGRDVPDTVQALLEYPDGLRMQYGATLANSFESEFESYFGTDAAIVVRGQKAWMFKEVDAPALGWEVYAKKETFYKETGIALMAGASKQKNLTEDAAQEALAPTSLQFALQNFVRNAKDVGGAAEDFVANFGADDPKALLEHLATVPRQAYASYQDGYDATVIALKANEALLSGQRIELKKEWFELA